MHLHRRRATSQDCAVLGRGKIGRGSSCNGNDGTGCKSRVVHDLWPLEFYIGEEEPRDIGRYRNESVSQALDWVGDGYLKKLIRRARRANMKFEPARDLDVR